MAEARQHYEEALKIRRQLAQQNPDAYLPDVATDAEATWGTWISPRTGWRKPASATRRH